MPGRPWVILFTSWAGRSVSEEFTGPTSILMLKVRPHWAHWVAAKAVNSLLPVSLQNLLHSSAAPKTLLLSWEISSRLLSGTPSNRFACVRIIRCMTFNICTVFFFLFCFFSLKNWFDISGCKTVEKSNSVLFPNGCFQDCCCPSEVMLAPSVFYPH